LEPGAVQGTGAGMSDRFGRDDKVTKHQRGEKTK
jgi:hypothetical protein